MDNPQRILLTGARGFIGTHLVRRLIEDTGSIPHEVVCVDIEDDAITGPFDGIIHLAAVSRVKDAEADRIKALDTNIMLTARLLEWNPRWFIFASTCEKPTNIYGYTKRAAEDYIKLRCERYAIFRLTNVYGPGMAHDKLLPRIARDGIESLNGYPLPFEYVPVSVVAEMIRLAIPKFDDAAFKSYTMKMATGVAHTLEQLKDVATSY